MTNCIIVSGSQRFSVVVGPVYGMFCLLLTGKQGEWQFPTV